ncbi:MAG: RdgB/HAM1 family non-canonical purine NTP pyrophosphatase [Chitinophagales bacterium]|nr:RdgB/HAM1 family non-canonical purine NTP pyrophosphatase [Chitinophagales bacterium]
MNQLIFTTNNQHKVDEIKSIIGDTFNILSLKEAKIDIDIPEPYDTLQENASEKSKVIHQLTQQNCFSEDTGLEVEALNGEPGVKSARYAGEEKNFQANINKLLNNLKNIQNRNAQFRTVVSLIYNQKEYLFEDICKGKIISEQRGNSGFGYDPIFIPEGSNKTFAEMTMEEKNLFSHRKKAIQQLINFLSKIGKLKS